MYIDRVKQMKYKGLVIGIGIVALWFASLVFLLQLNIESMPGFLIPAAIIFQTFLYVGLFITTHDAMHGVIAPQHKKLNDFIGATAIFLYALFHYPRVHEKHWDHHGHPASEEDPDYHDGEHKSFPAWYGRFMFHYVTWRQLLGMAIAFNVLYHLANVPLANLALFWVAPSLLSTLQLFYFGTYLPHKEPPSGYNDEHCATTNDFPVFLSFITCYHFGYHWEHHAYPYVPWWMLPKVRKQVIEGKEIKTA
ncbi:MAG: beta-carotene ketolase [Candidatus Marinimicrobia bacterium]|nr:beta-carotene ketolase [Candidatus Neomarinimicrobiota bacterium]